MRSGSQWHETTTREVFIGRCCRVLQLFLGDGLLDLRTPAVCQEFLEPVHMIHRRGEALFDIRLRRLP